MARKYSPQEQAQLDAKAEQQFGLPPGTLSRYLDSGNTMAGMVALARDYKLDAQTLKAVFSAADRHGQADISPRLGANPGSQRSKLTAADYLKMGLAVGTPFIATGAANLFGGGGAAAGGGGNVPGSATAAGGYVPNTTIPMSSAGGAGGAGAAGAGNFFSNNWKKILGAGASLVGGRAAGMMARNAGEDRAGGATLQQLMPMLMKLMEQQQSQSAENYQYQQQQYQANQPLQNALRSMAMGMLPRQYTQGQPPPPTGKGY